MILKSHHEFKCFMTRLMFSTLQCLLFSTYFIVTSTMAQTTIKVVSQEGLPIANAVVELTLLDESLQAMNTDKVYIMDQVQKSFDPEVLVVPEGSLVSFPNSDDIRHHVYSFSPAKPFELKLYAGQPKSPIRFDQQGIVVLGCNIHDSMVGYIYVSNNKHVVKSNAKGLIRVDHPAEQLDSLSVWHPNAKEGVEHRQLISADEFQAAKGVITLIIDIDSPAPRDTFEDQFSNVQ